MISRKLISASIFILKFSNLHKIFFKLFKTGNIIKVFYFFLGLIDLETLNKRIGSMNLTDRETEILKQIKLGYSNKEIAENLGISRHTVKAHVGSILFKLGVKNRLLAAMYQEQL